MSTMHDVVVIGSGPSGAMAAQTLVESGVNTIMLDVGISDDSYTNKIPNQNFATLRSTDADQYNYFLGHNFSGIPTGDIGTGPQLTPPREHTSRDTPEWLPVESRNFRPLESIAYGGLGNAWGLACYVYSNKELVEVGLDAAATQNAYEIIAKRIGISGERDDATSYTVGLIKNLQPACNLEPSIARMYDSYTKHRDYLQSRGCIAGKTALALLTRPLGDRKPTAYNDMDFWANHGDSAYRPSITIEMLKKQKNFFYLPNIYVLTCKEKDGGVEIKVVDTRTREQKTFSCKKVVIAAGVLSTARIILRSFPKHGNALPLLSGSYSYIPCIQPRMFGKNPGTKKISYSQMSIFYDPETTDSPAATAMLYTYRSLMLFRLANQLPFSYADSLRLLALGTPSLVIAGVHHAERPSSKKYITLKKSTTSITGDVLEAHYALTQEEVATNRHRERALKKALQKLGCYPVKRIDPGHGASVHYGGTLPFDESGKPYTLNSQGVLGGTQHITVADGSGFRYLPPKGPTLSFMANAHIVATHVIKSLHA